MPSLLDPLRLCPLSERVFTPRSAPRIGFIQTLDEVTVVINTTLIFGDPCNEFLSPGTPVGVLGIDYGARRRNRLTGKITAIETCTRTAAALIARNEVFYLVLLDRTDSELWRRNARENAAYLGSFFPRPEMLIDLAVTPTDRLRIWEVREIAGGL